MKNTISRMLQDSIEVNNLIIEQQVGLIENIVDVFLNAYKNKKKLVFFGNGGSAADAQHLATEFVCRFKKNRRAFPAIALTTNTSLLTAIGNDLGFDFIFSRQIEAIVNQGDVVVGITTSGNSKNVLEAIEAAKKKGAVTVIFTGKKGEYLSKLVDFCFIAPSLDTPRIQEAHITVGHIICELVEESLV